VSVLEKTGDDDSANLTWNNVFRYKVKRKRHQLSTCLSSNVCDGSCCDFRHPMNTCVSGSGGLGFLFDGTGGSEDVFIRLEMPVSQDGRSRQRTDERNTLIQG